MKGYCLTFEIDAIQIQYEMKNAQGTFKKISHWACKTDKNHEALINYHKVASSNTSRLEAHAGFFKLLMKGIFDPYVLCPFDKKMIF